MIVTHETLDGLFRGFSAAFNKGFGTPVSHYRQIAMTASSNTREETYAWLGAMPRIREWVGDKVLNGLAAHGYTIKNKSFELTVEVPRNDIEDDRYGVFGPMFEEMGREAASHPDTLVFGLLKDGFTTPCYDGQYFFDEEHPSDVFGGGDAVPISNMQGGDGEPWFLLDTSRAVKPIVWQERKGYKMIRADADSDPRVFFGGKFVYGVEARVNAGFGLWQLAFGSKAPLSAANYRDARAAMASYKNGSGRPLGITADTLVVGPALEEAARQLLIADRTEDDASNVWKGTAKLIVTPWLA